MPVTLGPGGRRLTTSEYAGSVNNVCSTCAVSTQSVVAQCRRSSSVNSSRKRPAIEDSLCLPLPGHHFPTPSMRTRTSTSMRALPAMACENLPPVRASSTRSS